MRRAGSELTDAGHAGGSYRVLPMTHDDLDAVLEIEHAAYAFPWSRGNFIDSLSAGHPAQLLCNGQSGPLGYFVAMPGVDELHLLNLTVAPAAQGSGHGRYLLGLVLDLCRKHAAHHVWLEVRQSNHRAQFIYERFGFHAVGLRKGYYPAPHGQRENAVVMSLSCTEAK